MVLWSYLESKYTHIQIIRFAAIIMVIFAALMPFCADYARYIVTDPNGIYTDHQKAILFFMVVIMLSGKTIAAVLGILCFKIGYIPVIIMVNNSCPENGSLGTVHGFGQIAANIVRSAGPAITGVLWSWSLQTTNSFPFDFHFTMFLVAALALITVSQTYLVQKFQ
jgi:hypothetical protein